MGTYLTDDQIKRAQEELRIVYAMPYASSLVGPAWEQILASIKGGAQTQDPMSAGERWKRDNRPHPDVVVTEHGASINYSLKTEALRVTKQRQHAADFLGFQEDIIVARPKVDDLLDAHTLQTIPADDLGALVLRYYNERIVARYQWHVISFLLRLDTEAQAPCEFIYWEERPPTEYDPGHYWWRDSGKATGSNRNINGFPHAVAQSATPLPRAKFKFTSGGKQFYILYDIPGDADIWTVKRTTLTVEQVQEAITDEGSAT